MKKGTFISKTFAFLLITLIIVGPFMAATTTPVHAQSLTAAERAQLEAELAQLEAELAQKQKELAGQKNQSTTLQGEVARLAKQISAKNSEIKLKGKKIVQLTGSITEKQKTILTLSEQIESHKESLAQLLRKTDEMDKKTLTSFLVSSQNLSEFYVDVSHFDKLKQEVKSSVDSIREIKGVTEIKKTELEKEQDKTLDEKKELEQIQKNIEKDKAAQNSLLNISKNKEKEYQKVIAEQQAKVGAIKAKLFSLAGGAQAIRFDIALQYANQAATATGVDPAFVLAILTQESSLGKNVGQCYLSDPATGAAVGANTGRVFTNGMKPTRDVQPFMDITARLGLDWKKTLVSCPIAGVAGWGGAMGPAQFIPSTWKIFEKRLKTALGHEANPWAAQDAFMASAMYLTDLGAVGSSYSAQIRAACKYYGSGGSSCSYGTSVMKLKAAIQADIDYLNQYGISRR